MPGFDRTGPLGLGPRTGGRFGLCSGNPIGRRPLRGFCGRPWRWERGGMGLGWRRGLRRFGFGWNQTARNTEDDRQALQEELRQLEERAAYLKERLGDLS